jgi:hypothetical protein
MHPHPRNQQLSHVPSHLPTHHTQVVSPFQIPSTRHPRPKQLGSYRKRDSTMAHASNGRRDARAAFPTERTPRSIASTKHSTNTRYDTRSRLHPFSLPSSTSHHSISNYPTSHAPLMSVSCAKPLPSTSTHPLLRENYLELSYHIYADHHHHHHHPDHRVRGRVIKV